MIKIKLAGIYKIEHQSGFYYIGKSLDIFSRWSSHYTNIKFNKHSSIRFQELWNKSNPSEWVFSILEYCSLTDFKKSTQSKGTELKKLFNKHLLIQEKYWINQFSINFSLNQNNKQFNG